MILILSSTEIQRSVEDVIDWIEYLGGEYVRLNGADMMKSIPFSLSLSNSETTTTLSEYDLNQVKTVWFRGFIRHRLYTKNIIDNLEASNDSISELKLRTIYELRNITNAFFEDLSNKKQTPSLSSMKLSKYEVLKEAIKIGFAVPDSIITNSKSEIMNFYHKHSKKIISKSLYETVYFEDQDGMFFFKTELLTEELLDSTTDYFFPSLFQQYIDKQFELRVFFLDDICYPMAIFSQLDNKTSTDFRNYNINTPNRTVPYILPTNIERKIKKLMKLLKLNTGSIDLIKDKKGDYIFLEVNPTGQFGMTSYPCNYHLEKLIAKFLIQNDK